MEPALQHEEQTLPEMRQEPHVSLSQVQLYQRCPEKYLHSYIAKTPRSHRNSSLAFGASMHAALAAHYEHIQDTGEKPDINMLHAAFSDRWNVEMKDEIPVRFDEGETEGAIKDSGIALLELLHRSVPAPERILHVELPFAVDIPNPMADGYLEEKLIGVMDLVVRSNGNPLIVEHKTASRRYSEHRLKYDLQPTVYKFAARSLDIESPSLQFQLFLRTKKPAIELYPVTRTERDECEMILTCAMVLKSVREGIFFPLRDWHCDDCEYAYRCRGKGGA